MKEKTKGPEEVEKTRQCPQCQGTAVVLAPIKVTNKRMAVYGCKACGFAFKADGGAWVDTAHGLQDVFRGATLGNQALIESMAGQNLNPATRALLLTMITEYGLQMWFDGMKQGILLGALQQEAAKNDGKDGGV